MKESVPNSDVRKMAKMEKDQVIGVLIQILKKSRKWRNGERSSYRFYWNGIWFCGIIKSSN